MVNKWDINLGRGTYEFSNGDAYEGYWDKG
jgi:hypothetical protein